MTKTVMTPTDLREMAADCEKFNQTPPIQADEYQRLYLRITRYAPRYMTEAADELERLKLLIKHAGDLLTVAAPDAEFCDDGELWTDACDDWMKEAGYGQPASSQSEAVADHDPPR